MKNMYDYNDFRSKKTKINEQVEEQIDKTNEINESEINEGAQLYDNTWKVRTRVEVPSSLINSYVKKVEQQTGEDPRKKWSEQELAEEITKFVTSSYLSVENLPVSIITNVQQEPKIQTQEEMPEETQVQSQVQPEEETQTQPQPQSQEGQAQVNVEIDTETQTQPQSQEVAQKVPQSQKGGQSQEI